MSTLKPEEIYTLVAKMQKNAQVFGKNLYTNTPGCVEFEGEFYPPTRLHHLERRMNAKVPNPTIN